MENQRGNNVRRKFFIDKKFQSRFIIKFCLLILLACFLFGGLVYFFSLQTTTTAFENSRLVIKGTADYLLPFLLITSLITVVIVGLATIAITLFISHRIAGPAYRFEKITGHIANGDLSLDVKLRSKDQLQPIAQGLDGMVKKLRFQVARINEKTSGLSQCIKKLEGSKDEEARIQIINDLEKLINELDKEIKYFKL